MFEKAKGFVKSNANKIAGACTGVLTAVSGAISAHAEDTEAVSAARSLLTTATDTLNIANIVAIIGAGIGAVIGLFLAWWGARKLIRMLVNAFKKGKISM